MALPQGISNMNWGFPGGGSQQLPDYNDFWWGQPEAIMQFGRFTPAQQDIFKQLLMSGMNQLQNPMEGFEPLRKRAMTQFNQQIVPSLAERFGAVTNARASSPSFLSQLSSAGAGLQENLADMESQYKQQSLINAMQMLGMAATPQYENMFRARTPGLFESLIPGLSAAGGQMAGAYTASKLAPLLMAAV